MAVLLLLGYAAICIVIFRILRVPVNKWTVTTAGIGGVVIVGGLLALMNYNHPFTTDARLYFYTTPIVPEVKGRVVEVAVKPNAPLKRGDILFKIDPRPYQFVVDQKKAALAEAQQGVKQLKASLDQASAAVEKAKTQFALAQQTYDRQAELLDKKVVAQATVDTAQRNLDAAKQTLAGAEAAEQRARLAFTSEVGGVNTTVAQLAAALRDAEYDLEQTTATAPTDGYVTQLFLRPGMMASASPAMVFIHAHDQVFRRRVSANRRSAASPGHRGGDRVRRHPRPGIRGQGECPGRRGIAGPVTGHGRAANPEDRAKSPGLALVNIRIADDLSSYQLSAGATAQVAVYSDHMAPVAVIRRILLRMKAWLNYVM